MKHRITNIVPILLDGQIIEAGAIFSPGEGNNDYLGPNLYRISKEQAANPRFFKPYSEGNCQRSYGENYLHLDDFFKNVMDEEDLTFTDDTRFNLGNYFDETTKLNQYGADIQSVRKCIKFTLKYPKLWEALRWAFDLDGGDNPISDPEGAEARRLLEEIEEST